MVERYMPTLHGNGRSVERVGVSRRSWKDYILLVHILWAEWGVLCWSICYYLSEEVVVMKDLNNSWL